MDELEDEEDEEFLEQYRCVWNHPTIIYDYFTALGIPITDIHITKNSIQKKTLRRINIPQEYKYIQSSISPSKS